MKSLKVFKFITISLCFIGILSACSKQANDAKNSKKSTLSAVVLADIGGIDDKSFNQSAWEGLQEWGKENNLPEGISGYTYLQANDATDYTTNINQAIANDFDIIFGIGYLLTDTVSIAADENPDKKFVIIDDIINGKQNVASVTFKDNEAAYLAGVAAANTTKTNKVGFIGGEEGLVVNRFKTGFERGVKDEAKNLGKSITLDVKYAASFSDPSKGKAIAASMYNNGSDIIYHASGATGQGVFQEAKNLNESNIENKVWVIGVDRDQEEDGSYTLANGKKDNFTLTSTLKNVNSAIIDIANSALKNNFPNGVHLSYGLKNDGVRLTDGQLSNQALQAVQEAKEKISSSIIKVPEE